MRRAGLRPKLRRRFRVTTRSEHRHPTAPNLLAQRFRAERSNEAWLADLTYIPTREGWLYLAVVIDLFARRVVGWATSGTMTRELVIDALQVALGATQADPWAPPSLGPRKQVRVERLPGAARPRGVRV